MLWIAAGDSVLYYLPLFWASMVLALHSLRSTEAGLDPCWQPGIKSRNPALLTKSNVTTGQKGDTTFKDEIAGMECICPCLLLDLAWQITSCSSSRQNIWWERHLDGGWCDVSNKIYKEKYKTRMSDLPGCHGVMSSWMCLGKVCTWRAVKRDGGEWIYAYKL